MDIIEKIRREFEALAVFHVKHLWLFGSAARGERDPHDVDILVEFAKPPDLLDYMGLKFKLEELLGMPVDLVSKSACRERFLRHIEGELLDVA